MFFLNLYTNTVKISFASSVVNVVLSIKTEITQCLVNQNQREFPFAIQLTWTPKSFDAMKEDPNRGFLDPFRKTGLRWKLQKKLSQINYGVAESTSFEILSSERQKIGELNGCIMNGVVLFDVNSKRISESVTNFKESRKEVLQAVIAAFQYAPAYTHQYDFAVSIELDLEEAALKARFAKFSTEEQQQAIEWMERQRLRWGQQVNWLTCAVFCLTHQKRCLCV